MLFTSIGCQGTNAQHGVDDREKFTQPYKKNQMLFNAHIGYKYFKLQVLDIAWHMALQFR